MSIATLIRHHHRALENHDFIQFMRTSREVDARAFAFVPDMTFFVLGFRDILENCRIEPPLCRQDVRVNIHCCEDSEHWLWFIEDLERLAARQLDSNFHKMSCANVLRAIWSDECRPVRQLTYRVHSHIQHAKSAQEKLVIIDCLEAAFAVFISGMSLLIKRAGLYHQLRYFGHEHHQSEAGHSGGSWIGSDGEAPGNIEDFDIFRERQMISVIDDIFNGFDEVFSCWLSSVTVRPLIAV